MACWPASSAATSGNTMAATTSSSSARSRDRKSTRLNSSHQIISYAVFCLKKEKHTSELQSPDHLVCRLLLEKKKDRVPGTEPAHMHPVGCYDAKSQHRTLIAIRRHLRPRA